MNLTNKQLKKELEKLYWKKNAQFLNFNSWCDIKQSRKENNFYSADLVCGDYSFIDIQSRKFLYQSQLSTTPYCQRVEWGWMITVNHSNQLTDLDIQQAISYVMYEVLDFWRILNLKFEGKHFHRFTTHDYQKDPDSLREQIEFNKQLKDKKHGR